MRTPTLVVGLLAIGLASCGQETVAESQPSVQPGVPAPTLAAVEVPTRQPAPELPGDDPAFRAAIDVYDSAGIEDAAASATGLPLRHVSAGYFGQKFSLSLWAPVSDEVALAACHELVAAANAIDFPATAMQVRQKSYEDFTWSEVLAEVGQTGTCAVVD